MWHNPVEFKIVLRFLNAKWGECYKLQFRGELGVLRHLVF